MSAAPRRLDEARRLHRLRERRAELALSAVASAQAVLVEAQADLSRREQALVELDGRRSALEAWFGSPGGREGRLIEQALARRASLDAENGELVSARDSAIAHVQAAQAGLAEAVAILTRARARRDAAALQLSQERGTLARRVELGAELEFEERGVSGQATGAFA